MPQLDLLTYLTQYSYTLIFLFFLLVLLINFIIPRIQKQFLIRIKFNNVIIKKESINSEIFKNLFKL
uniref:ATP synthase F0 subunit 8 n=1 Tax=Ptilocaulis walpersi TaxID=479640 RepID=I6LIK2_9METZ|nr:ATP synthase F0 subunit 8 [Ptilocaulis walpersi]ABW83883.1 ATP synthase F0 subunit 8 [Ptilocaulis walpersi]